MSLKKYCIKCKELMIFKTIKSGDTTFGRYKCNKCKTGGRWREVTVRKDEAE